MTDLLKRAARMALAVRMGVPAWWLDVVFEIESQNNPKAINPYTNAVGLIQFMPATLKDLGYTTDEVLNMDYVNQTYLVYQYFFRYDAKQKKYVPKIPKALSSLTNFYLMIFYPAAISRPDDFVLGSERSPAMARAIFAQNPGYRNAENQKLGVVRKKDITSYVVNKARSMGYSDFERFLSNLDVKIDNLFKKS